MRVSLLEHEAAGAARRRGSTQPSHLGVGTLGRSMRRPVAAVVVAVSLSVSVLSAATSSSATDDRTEPDAARLLAETTADRALAEAVGAVAGTPAEPNASVTLALRDLSL